MPPRPARGWPDATGRAAARCPPAGCESSDPNAASAMAMGSVMPRERTRRFGKRSTINGRQGWRASDLSRRDRDFPEFVPLLERFFAKIKQCLSSHSWVGPSAGIGFPKVHQRGIGPLRGIFQKKVLSAKEKMEPNNESRNTSTTGTSPLSRHQLKPSFAKPHQAPVRVSCPSGKRKPAHQP